MKRKTILALILLGGLVTLFICQRGAVAKLCQQNESLRAEKEEAVRLEEENRDLPNLRAVAEASSGPSPEHSELLRLRNEARRLRAQKQELENLRAANDRVATDIKSVSLIPHQLSEMEGYVGKETWANTGFATPDSPHRKPRCKHFSGR